MKSKTLTLKKPLSIIQEAKLYQTIGSLLEEDKQKKCKVETEALKKSAMYRRFQQQLCRK